MLTGGDLRWHVQGLEAIHAHARLSAVEQKRGVRTNACTEAEAELEHGADEQVVEGIFRASVRG
jgi:hypothetical protein